jgi:tRNA(adenine34) deaminase
VRRFSALANPRARSSLSGNVSDYSDKTVPPCPLEKRHPSLLAMDDTYFMTLAYNLAIDAWNKGEVPIGAVVEYGGHVVAKAHNCVESLKDPTAHAEILALTSAAQAIGDWRMDGATLYVTKEPCPMCSGAMVMSRMSRVVYAVRDPKMGCLGGAVNLNDLPRSNHRCELVAGVMEAECLELIQAFFAIRRAAAQEAAKQAGEGTLPEA